MSGAFGTIGRDAARDQQTLDAVGAALSRNEIDKAIGLARAALEDGFVAPLLLNLRAFWFEQQGQHEKSLADLERAHAMLPDDVPILNALGLCYTKFERWDDAIAIFAKVTHLMPDFAPGHYNQGWATEFNGDLKVARACYESALAVQPRYPEAIARLAYLAARRADWDTADALAEQALALDDKQFIALQSQIRAAIAQKNHERADALIAKLIADKRAMPLDVALAYALLGDLRNAQKRYAEAFAAYTEGNLRRKEIFAPRYAPPGSDTAYTYLRWVTEYFEAAPAAQIKADRRARAPRRSGEPRQHVFLVGSPRSGTTLLENILMSHPDVVSLEERSLMYDAINEYLTNTDGLDRLTRLGAADAARFRKLYWDRVAHNQVDPDNRVFIDKHPLNAVNLAVVAKLFPEAKILFALRDPRDVVLSCFRHSFQMNRSMYEYLTLEGTARFYDLVMRISMAYREKLDLDLHVVRHESLLEDFEGEARRVCDFLQIEWSAELHNFAEHAKKRFIATPSAIQVMRGLNKSGVGQWRPFAEQLEPVMPIIRPWIAHFGYDPD